MFRPCFLCGTRGRGNKKIQNEGVRLVLKGHDNVELASHVWSKHTVSSESVIKVIGLKCSDKITLQSHCLLPLWLFFFFPFFCERVKSIVFYEALCKDLLSASSASSFC